MSSDGVYEVSTAVLSSLGGAGVIIIGLSSWLGKVWATRVMNKEKHKQQESLTQITESIKSENNIELEKLKARIDSYSHVYKLDKTNEHEQKKLIKAVISKNKVSIIDSAEALNHRMWNFNKNHHEQWHVLNDEVIDKQYYLYSFTYRILVFFSWCNTIEKEMIYLDSTVADSKDLDFVKFLKIFPKIMCEVTLFDGLDYNHKFDTDHFFTNKFQSLINQVRKDDGVISYDEFQNKIKENEIDVSQVITFLSGISPTEERFRWFRLQTMHYALLMFINSFGYDFQNTEASKIKYLMDAHKENPTIPNLLSMIESYKLNGNDGVISVLTELNA